MCCQWEMHLVHRPVVHFCISLTMGVPESDRFTLQEHTVSLCCLSLSLSLSTHTQTHTHANTIDPSLKRLRINEQSTRLIQFSLRHGGDAIQALYPPHPTPPAQLHVAGWVLGDHIMPLVIDQSQPLLAQYSRHNELRISQCHSVSQAEKQPLQQQV